MFGKFSCNTYVIVVLNCNTVVFLNMRNFLWLARRFLVWCVNFSIFHCGFTVFRIPLTALESFFCACVYFCYKTGFDSVIPRPVAVLERSTLLVPNNIPMIICYAVKPINRKNYQGIYNNGCWNPMVQPQHLHILPFIIIIIITIILLLLLLFEKVILVLIQS